MANLERKIIYSKFIRSVDPEYGQMVIGINDGTEVSIADNFDDASILPVTAIRDMAINQCTKPLDRKILVYAERDEHLISKVLEAKKAKLATTS